MDRGLTHLAITDHDRIDVAQEARALAPDGLTVIVGEEVKTRDGDLICVFLEQAIPPGLSAMETIAAAREQGGLVGIPHPFDRMRGSLLRDAAMAEPRPARRLGRGAQRPGRRAWQRGRVGVRARARPAGHRRVGRAFDHGDRRRLHRGRRRPVHAGRPAGRARTTSRSCPVGRATSSGCGRRSRRASIACAATPESSHERWRRPGPSSDGRRRGRSGRVRCDGGNTRARPRRDASRAGVAHRGARDRADRGRADLARPVGCASRGRSSRSSSRSRSSGSSCT